MQYGVSNIYLVNKNMIFVMINYYNVVILFKYDLQ